MIILYDPPDNPPKLLTVNAKGNIKYMNVGYNLRGRIG